MLLGESRGQLRITPGRMKWLGQSRNYSQLWMCLVVEKCKEIEENERMGKTRDVLKKIGVITLHARMGIKKDRNSKDQTEAEEMKNRWQEYTEELYKKVLFFV